jgi:hypothetical protein
MILIYFMRSIKGLLDWQCGTGREIVSPSLTRDRRKVNHLTKMDIYGTPSAGTHGSRQREQRATLTSRASVRTGDSVMNRWNCLRRSLCSSKSARRFFGS